MARVRTAIMISGQGSNMEALVAAAQAPDYPAEIALVLSNNPDAAGLAFAERAGLRAIAVDHRRFKGDREAHEREIDALLRSADVELVALAGYMRVLTPLLVRAWAGKMLNIHPSLLPDFPGLDTHARAIAAAVSRHGCSVHLVSEGVDEGPVLGRAALDVSGDDTAESLGARVLKLEHKLYPDVLASYARRIGAGEV